MFLDNGVFLKAPLHCRALHSFRESGRSFFRTQVIIILYGARQITELAHVHESQGLGGGLLLDFFFLASTSLTHFVFCHLFTWLLHYRCLAPGLPCRFREIHLAIGEASLLHILIGAKTVIPTKVIILVIEFLLLSLLSIVCVVFARAAVIITLFITVEQIGFNFVSSSIVVPLFICGLLQISKVETVFCVAALGNIILHDIFLFISVDVSSIAGCLVKNSRCIRYLPLSCLLGLQCHRDGSLLATFLSFVQKLPATLDE